MQLFRLNKKPKREKDGLDKSQLTSLLLRGLNAA